MRLFLFVITALIVFSCKKSDLTLPIISGLTLNNSAVETLNFQPGETFALRATIEDNIELGQYKIDIHHDFDGHSHKTSTERFAEIRIKNISGTTYNLEETFSIPGNASSGTYHGTIRALDAEGNLSEVAIFYFNVNRDNQPTIVMNLPETIGVGQVLNVDGVITAFGEATIRNVKIRIRSSNTGNNVLNETYNLQEIPTTWNPFVDGDVSVTINPDESGKLFFRLWVEDSNGNNTIFEKEIEII